MTTQILRRAGLTLAILAMNTIALSACSKAPARSLADTKVPAGFTFQTTHSVAANILAASSIAGPNGAPLEISMNGHQLFRGHVMPDQALSLHLSMPLSEGKLVATLHGLNGPSTVEGLVRDGKVSWQFQ